MIPCNVHYCNRVADDGFIPAAYIEPELQFIGIDMPEGIVDFIEDGEGFGLE